MERIKALPTYYEGYQFRSRLEARWAHFFDVLGIEWEYEPQPLRLSDGTNYLPDFYLSESESFFEVKGVMDNDSLHKILQLVADGKPVTVGYGPSKDFPGPRFRACSDLSFVTGDPRTFELEREDCSFLMRCEICGKFFFGGWVVDACPCCNGCIDRKRADGMDFMGGNGDLLSPGKKYQFGNGYRALVEKACESFKNCKFDHGRRPDPRWRHEKGFRELWVGYEDAQAEKACDYYTRAET